MDLGVMWPQNIDRNVIPTEIKENFTDIVHEILWHFVTASKLIFQPKCGGKIIWTICAFSCPLLNVLSCECGGDEIPFQDAMKLAVQQ